MEPVRTYTVYSDHHVSKAFPLDDKAVPFADHQRALDVEKREVWHKENYIGLLHHDNAALTAQLATLQAQLRQAEGERDQWIAANTKEPINEPVTYQALAGARFVAKRAFDELVKARYELSTLRQLVAYFKSRCMPFQHGGDHGWEVRGGVLPDHIAATLVAQDAGTVSTSIIGKQVPPSQWDKNAGVSGDVS